MSWKLPILEYSMFIPFSPITMSKGIKVQTKCRFTSKYLFFHPEGKLKQIIILKLFNHLFMDLLSQLKKKKETKRKEWSSAIFIHVRNHGLLF